MGVGFLENVDEKCLRIEWRNPALMVESQKPIRVLYEDEIDETERLKSHINPVILSKRYLE